MPISPRGIVVITLALLAAVTALTFGKQLPTEVAAAIFGSLASSLVMTVQRTAMANVVTEAVKKASLAPPRLRDDEKDRPS